MEGSRKLTEKTLAGLGWTSFAMGGQAVLQIVALVFLARLLTPQDFGLFAAALVIAGFSAIFSELGVSPAIVQRPTIEPRHIRTGFTLSVTLSLVTGLAIYIYAEAIAGFFQIPALADVVRIMAIGFPLQGISTVAQALALRSFRFRWLAMTDTCAFGLGYVVVAPALTMLDLGVYALVGAYLTQQSLRAFVLLKGQPHEKMPMLERPAVRELLYFGTGFTLAKVSNYFASQADNLVVARWLGPAALGLYSNAYQLMASPAMMMGQVLDRVLFPTMASVQHEPARLARAYRSGLFACSSVMLPASVIVAILAPEIVLILLGPTWVEVAVPLRVLACALLFRTSYKISDTIVRATGFVYARAWRQAVFAVAVLVGAYVGQHWGLAGVATGVFLALGLNFAQMAQLSLRIIGMRWRDFGEAHLAGIAFAVIVGTTAYGTAIWLRDANAGSLAVVGGVMLVCALLVPVLIWVRPQLFLGPDRVHLLRAIANVAPVRMQRGVAILERRVSG